MVFAETTCLPLIHSPIIIQVNTVLSRRRVENKFIIHSQSKYEKLANVGSPVVIIWPETPEGGGRACVLLITYTADAHGMEHLCWSPCLGYHPEKLTDMREELG